MLVIDFYVVDVPVEMCCWCEFNVVVECVVVALVHEVEAAVVDNEKPDVDDKIDDVTVEVCRC